MPDRSEAAAARRAALRSANDRPTQRRLSEHASPAGRATPVRARLHDVTVRASGDDGSLQHFAGYASVTESPYDMWDMFGPYSEVVAAGAFGQTLATPGLDVPLVLQHDPLRRIARTTNGSLTLAEDDQGLHVDAPSLDPADADVAYIVPKLRSGLIDEMSFMFSITAGQWSPDYTEFRVNSVDINRGDVSIVGYGANPATLGELRADSLEQLIARADLADARRLHALAGQLVRSLAPAMTKQQALALP